MTPHCRAEKKVIKQQVEADKALLQRASLAIELVPERIDDVKHAAIVKFGSTTRTMPMPPCGHTDAPTAAADDIQARKAALKRKSIFAGRSPATATPTTPLAPPSSAKRKKLDPEAAKRDKALRHSQHLAMVQNAAARAHATPTHVEAAVVVKHVPRPALVDYGNSDIEGEDE